LTKINIKTLKAWHSSTITRNLRQLQHTLISTRYKAVNKCKYVLSAVHQWVDIIGELQAVSTGHDSSRSQQCLQWLTYICRFIMYRPVHCQAN